MASNPLTTIRSARRAALRRRYGYAALRILRRGMRRAIARHKAFQITPDITYAVATDQLVTEYWHSLKLLLKRWPNLDPADPRAEP